MTVNTASLEVVLVVMPDRKHPVCLVKGRLNREKKNSESSEM